MAGILASAGCCAGQDLHNVWQGGATDSNKVVPRVFAGWTPILCLTIMLELEKEERKVDCMEIVVADNFDKTKNGRQLYSRKCY